LSFTVPQEVIDRLNTIFPKSKDRVKIALSLLGFDHDPTRGEKETVAQASGKTVRSVDEVIERLIKESLFASEIGSIPMWRLNEKARIASLIPSLAPAQPPTQPPAQPLTQQPTQPLTQQPTQPLTQQPTQPLTQQPIELPVPTVGVSMENTGVVGVGRQAGVAVPIHSSVQAQELKEIKAKQEGFETVVKAELGGIKELLQRALEQPKQASAVAAGTEVRVVSGVKGQTQQPAAEQSESQVESVNADDGLFPGVNRTELAQMLLEAQRGGAKRLPGGLTESFVNAPPKTIRKIIIEVTTYTQMLYEKAKADEAFEGSFSDFLNSARDDVPEEVGILVPRCDAPILLGWAVHENPPQFTVLGLGSVLHVIH